jgi:hypothetical protein
VARSRSVRAPLAQGRFARALLAQGRFARVPLARALLAQVPLRQALAASVQRPRLRVTQREGSVGDLSLPPRPRARPCLDLRVRASRLARSPPPDRTGRAAKIRSAELSPMSTSIARARQGRHAMWIDHWRPHRCRGRRGSPRSGRAPRSRAGAPLPRRAGPRMRR